MQVTFLLQILPWEPLQKSKIKLFAEGVIKSYPTVFAKSLRLVQKLFSTMGPFTIN